MKESLFIQIDKRRLVPVIPIERGAENRVHLTTIQDNQRKALVQFLVRTEEGTRPFTEYIVENIPLKPAGEPRIDCLARVEGSRLQLSLLLEKRSVFHEEYRIPLTRRARRFILPAVMAGAAAVIGLAVFFLVLNPGTSVFRTAGPQASVAARTPVQTQTAQAVTPAPSTSAPSAAPTEQEPEARTQEQAVPAAPAPSGAAGQDAAPKIQPQEAAPQPQPAPPQTADQTPTAVTETAVSQLRPAAFQSLPLTIYFPPDSALLSEAEKEKLRNLLPELRSRQDAEIIITGYCALFGTEAGRREISSQRAEAVFGFLRSLGWNPGRDPAVSGAGGENPVTREEAMQHLNRRVEISAGGK